MNISGLSVETYCLLVQLLGCMDSMRNAVTTGHTSILCR